MTQNIDFLEKLIKTGSPTGREQELQRYLHSWAEKFADKVESDMLGNMAVVINPGTKLRVLLAAHCDRIGFMVMKITEEGLLRVDPLGGVDEATVLGAHVTVHAANGDIPGVIGKVSTHLQSETDKEKVPSLDHIWIDIGAKDKEDAEKKVKIGDYISYELRVVKLDNNRITAPGLDNILGVYVVMQTAKRCKEKGINVSLYCVSTVQEELGARGAASATAAIQPHIAIAVDTTLASDVPGKMKKQTTPSIYVGKGPSIATGPNTSPPVLALLRKAAAAKDISFQLEPNAKPEGNDAKEMQMEASGTASASVGLPIRNMHTQVEVASLDDIDAAIDLLTEFVMGLNENVDLLPINHSIDGEKADTYVEEGGLGTDQAAAR